MLLYIRRVLHPTNTVIHANGAATTNEAPRTLYLVRYTRVRKFTCVVLFRMITYTLACVKQASLIPSNMRLSQSARSTRQETAKMRETSFKFKYEIGNSSSNKL